MKWASEYKRYPRLADLTLPVLRKLMFETGDMDRISALFYLRATREPRTKRFLDYLARTRRELARRPAPDLSRENITFAMVPGMFYADNPNVGADGKQLRQLAEELGLKSELLKVDQTGSVDANARFICDYLDARQDRRIVIASISKSGAEVKRALQICADSFGPVIGWLNVAGLLYGSYIVNIVNNDWWLRMKSRLYFWKRGYDWAGLQSLARGPNNPLEGPVKIPRHMRVVSMVPITIFQWVTPRARPYYQALLHWGPNDGQILLGESYVKGGVIYPSWRNDHYFRFPEPPHTFPATILYLTGKKL